MSTINCPHCSTLLLVSAGDSGRSVSCPSCNQWLDVPFLGELIEPPPVAPLPSVEAIHPRRDFQQPQVIVVAGAQPQPRTRRSSGTRFSDSFATSAPILVCALLFCAGVPIAFYYGARHVLLTATEPIRESAEKSSKERDLLKETAMNVAAQEFRKHGIVELSSDCDVSEYDGQVSIDGKGASASGIMHDIRATYDVAMFNGKQRWQLARLLIDGKEPKPKRR